MSRAPRPFSPPTLPPPHDDATFDRYLPRCRSTEDSVPEPRNQREQTSVPWARAHQIRPPAPTPSLGTVAIGG
ncbi:hypothetical protein NL676_001746 [Syzygium grande]|nr:hypothetical protein NL676_001746 [Syzygium grande]